MKNKEQKDNKKITAKSVRLNEVITRQNKTASCIIKDSDIATIEALHDILLDRHGYTLDFYTLKNARELTAKMYKALESV